MSRMKLYDQNALVLAIASGSEPLTKVARRLGLSACYVRRVAAGKARPDLQPLVAAARARFLETAAESIIPFARRLLERQIHVALHGPAETARRAREWILDTYLWPERMKNSRPAGWKDGTQLAAPPAWKLNGGART